MNLDLGSFLSALLGALSVIAGQIVTNHYTAKREREQWERQLTTDREKREEEKAIADAKRIREIYRNAIRALTAYIGTEEDDTANKTKCVEDVTEWIALLGQYLGENDFGWDIGNYYCQFLKSSSPDKDVASQLRDEVIRLFIQDRALSSNADNRAVEEAEAEAEIDKGVLRVLTSSEFRHQQFVQGNLIPAVCDVNYDVTRLSPSQRRLLWKLYSSPHNSRLPLPSSLNIPTYDERQKKLSPCGASWAARINPLKSTMQQVFDAWEKDYNEAILEVQEKESANKSQ